MEEVFVRAHQTRNMNSVGRDQYNKLLNDNATNRYKIAPTDTHRKINTEAKHIVTELGILERVERMAEKEPYVTLKDHKDDFRTKLPCRLINPAKSETGKIS